ncbi:MAG TPA: XRE family transcriptional regulator [Verrucomicrobiales bacterium]|nr:XRE family transcriptional regulator [Verrucomicrobiales bacterium]
MCRPLEAAGTPPPWVAPVLERIAAEPSARLTADSLRELGVTPERARRWFRENFGMTFSVWARQRRLGDAVDRLRRGSTLDDVAVDSGFESHSGFREAVGRDLGKTPGRLQRDGSRAVRFIRWESPVGEVSAAASDAGVCGFGFLDRRNGDDGWAERELGFPAILTPGENSHLRTLREQLDEYFAGQRREFSVPLDPQGTPFQLRVWNELQRIPYGQTCSYAALANRLGQPQGMRAVARANAVNRIVILIPCHRVIGADGSLTGYGGGLWRKRLLLELERNGRLPGEVPPS